MAAIYGISAYQQTDRSWKSERSGSDKVSAYASSKADQTASSKESTALNVETRAWSPVSKLSSLIPRTTEYGSTVGDVQLSDKAKEYLNKLKAKFHNMEFITVSKDMKSQVQANAASYGNSAKQVVLIDEEKLERMAEDESFRKKYEGIIEMSQAKLANAKNSLTSSGANVKNFGMSVDQDGNESFFATVEKSQKLEKERIEKRAEEKKEQKTAEKKKAQKNDREEKLERIRDERRNERIKDKEPHDEKDIPRAPVQKEYVTIGSDSMEELLSKVQAYSFDNASSHVMTDEERALGSFVDFKG